MSGTPGTGRPGPRLSGLPTPRVSGIPAPGSRPRSSIGGSRPSVTKDDEETMMASLAAAVKARNPSDYLNGSVSAHHEPPVERTPAPRKSIGPRPSALNASLLSASTLRPPRPPSASSQTSHGSMRLQIPDGDSPNSFQTAFSTPIHTPGGVSRARTPSTTMSIRTLPSAYPSHRRPESRQSIGSVGRSSSRLGQLPERSGSRQGKTFEVGDRVRLESKGWEGTLRYLGEVHFRDGLWAGVELLPGFSGKGKNDGSVEGKRYFHCRPNMGVFISADKLSTPAPTYARPPSSASVSSRGGRATPLREPPTPDLETPSAFRSRVQAQAAASRVSAGSRASKFLGMTAQQLREAGFSDSSKQPETILESPVRSPNRPTTATPKSSGRQSFGLPTPNANRGRLSLGGVTPKAKPRTADLAVPMSPPLTLPALSAASTSANTSLQEEEITTPEERHMLESGTRAFQDRVAKLMSEDLSSARGPSLSTPPASAASFLDESPLALRSSQRLAERIEMLEQENRRLKAEAARSSAPSPSKAASQSLISDLQQKLAVSEEDLSQLRDKLQELEKSLQEQMSLRESEKEQAADVLSAADERVDEAEKKAAELIGEVDTLKKRLSELEKDRDEKVDHVQELERRIQLLVQQATEERDDLLQQVEELRTAGQETIAFYEEHKAAHEADRYDLEQQIQALEEQLRNLPDGGIAPTAVAQQAETATQIDNEALREQVAHYQSRISKLEDQLEDVQADRLKQEDAYRARIQKAKDQESNARKELENARQEMDGLKKVEEATRNRIEELEIALRESDEALENARAEIEGLRADVSDRTELRESADQMTKTSAQQSEELSQLKQQLDHIQHAKDDALAQCETLKREAETAALAIAELRARKEAMEKERSADDNVSLGPPLDERRRESYGSDTSKSRRSTVDPEKELRDQIKGLKHMIQELQKENAALASQKKVLEAENKSLSSEMDDLKDEIKTLEEAVERTILQEEQALAQESGSSGAPADTSASDLRAKHAAELRQLNDKLKEKESTIRNLNKEMADYESLIESKIYEEDDYTRKITNLESQVKQLKDKLSRTSSHSSRSGDSSHSTRSSAPSIAEEATCDLCGGRGHDFTSCPQLNGGMNPKSSVNNSTTPRTELFCDDCETFGHATADCPHSQDVF
ncbi:hypothetical protein CALCODRAFT_505884 [Calocera cornea HHB12733]|uniref:CAP-Gly domain-containing protein n=1 Tax=Calocera cornea HHB12733 TaxID=1353952 RepID=A0A165JN98_9BASI|nr:hypothetical protein CALCODRAFT_505884 [Calocera cornea HHB12733]